MLHTAVFSDPSTEAVGMQWQPTMLTLHHDAQVETGVLTSKH
jgi:hypothetical protein